jgi:hypothetical protein
MSWREFSYYINGLSGDTPLGRIISIRAEKDPDTVKHMTDDEKRIRNEYRKKMAFKKSDKDCDKALDEMKQAFMKMAK